MTARSAGAAAAAPAERARGRHFEPGSARAARRARGGPFSSGGGPQ